MIYDKDTKHEGHRERLTARVHRQLRVVYRVSVGLRLVWVWETPVFRPSLNLQHTTRCGCDKENNSDV